jgi:hypothetical protein
MPAEARILFFTKTEVARAAELYGRKVGSPASAGRIASVSFADTSGEIAATLRFAGSVAALDGITLAEQNLCKALVLLCRHLGIPLPARAPKSLAIADDDRLAMSITLGELPRRRRAAA